MAASIETQTVQETAEQLARQYDAVNLGCGDDQPGEFLNVDAVADCNPDLALDLEDRPWPFPDASFEEVRLHHVLEHLSDPVAVLEECARILQAGGRLDVRMPIGLDMQADPDHIPQNEWTWLTPEFLTGARHWDEDVGLELVDRDVELWSALKGIEHYAYQQYLNWRLWKFGGGRWCFGMPATSGEFIVQFQRNKP